MNTMMRLIEVAAWLELLLDVSLKATLLLAMAGLFSLTLRRTSASVRHLFWSVVVISLLALPILSLALPNWRVPVLPSFRATSAAPAVNAVKNVPLAPRPLETSLAIEEQRALSQAQVPLAPKARKVSEEDLITVASATDAIDAQSISQDSASPMIALNTVSKQPSSRNTKSYWLLAVMAIWMIGACAVLMRLLLGIAKVRRIMNQAQVITEPDWMASLWHLSSELQLSRKVMLYRGDQIKLPMTWGLWRSAVLLPSDCLNWSDDVRELVLLHELAHIKRGDCVTQLLGQLACAAYWFNPLVWTAARKLRVERELACDDYVLSVGAKASDYASCLVEIARSFGIARSASVVAVGMACSQLESRVRAILNPTLSRGGLSRIAITASCLVVLGLVGPLAAFSPWASAAMGKTVTTNQQGNKTQDVTGNPDQAPVAVPVKPEEPVTPSDLVEAQALGEALNLNLHSVVNVDPQIAVDAESIAAEAVQSAVAADVMIPAPAARPSPLPIPNPDMRMDFNFDLAQEAARTGSTQTGELNVDDIIQLKMFGVTPEYIEEMKRAGYGNLTARQLARLRSLGVNAEYLKQVKELGFDKASIEEIARLRLAGVTTDYAKAMSQLGYSNQSIGAITKMKMMGVTPEYIEALRKLGYDKLSVEELVKLRTHGVTENFIRETQGWGFGKLSAEELAQVRIHGVTPEYAAAMKAAGFTNLSLDELKRMRIHGLTTDYIKEMRGLGFDNLTLDQLIKLRTFGVTPDYVRKMRAAGLKNVSVNDLIKLRMSGVDDVLIKGLNRSN